MPVDIAGNMPPLKRRTWRQEREGAGGRLLSALLPPNRWDEPAKIADVISAAAIPARVRELGHDPPTGGSKVLSQNT